MTYAAALPTLTREWGMSASKAGFVQTCFFTGFSVSMFFTSWFSDHIGSKRIFLTFCWLSAAAALGFALYARSYSEALWLFAIVGFPRAARISPQSCWYRKNCRASGVVQVWGGCWPRCLPATLDRSVFPRALRRPMVTRWLSWFARQDRCWQPCLAPWPPRGPRT